MSRVKTGENKVELTVRLFKEGKTKEEIIGFLTKMFLDKGKSQDWSAKRAVHYLRVAKRLIAGGAANKGENTANKGENASA
jgi:hypothetical protein